MATKEEAQVQEQEQGKRDHRRSADRAGRAQRGCRLPAVCKRIRGRHQAGYIRAVQASRDMPCPRCSLPWACW